MRYNRHGLQRLKPAVSPQSSKGRWGEASKPVDTNLRSAESEVNTSWKASWNHTARAGESTNLSDASTVGYEVPYRFRVSVPNPKEEHYSTIRYSRDTNEDYTYTDFSGLRYPALRTGNNIEQYWKPRGIQQFLSRTSPLFLPAYRRLSPYLREVIAFLRELDPIRFSISQISERYALAEYTVEKICSLHNRDAYFRQCWLPHRIRRRISQAEAVMDRKEMLYAQRLGYDIVGDCWNAKPHDLSKAASCTASEHATGYDKTLQQAIVVEAASAFPVPSLRDPVIHKCSVDIEVKRTPTRRILNWVDPLDKVAI